MKRILSLLLSACILFSVSVVLADGPLKVESVNLGDPVSVPVRKTVTVRPKIEPQNAANKALSWSTSNPEVATVKNGVITGVAPGQAVITAAAQDGSGASGSLQVTVINPVKRIQPDHTRLVLAPGIVWPLFWTVEPADASNREVLWTSSDKKVATVNENGVISTHATGTCRITCAAADGSGVRAAVAVQVKAHDIMILEPGDVDVDFETEKATVNISIRSNGQVTNKTCERQFHTKNSCIISPEDMVIRPVKAGSDTISLAYTEKKQTVKTENYTVFVAPAAISETAVLDGNDNPAPIRFLNLDWGSTYPTVRDAMESRGQGLKMPSQRNDYLRSMVDGEIRFANITAFKAAVNLTYTPGDRLWEVRNSLFRGDLYFDPEISAETVIQAVRSVYSLGKGTQTGEGTYEWTRGHVKVTLEQTKRYTVVELVWDGVEEENAEVPEAEPENAPEEDPEDG